MECNNAEMGKRIARRRKQLKIRQNNFAEAIGISNVISPRYYMGENGRPACLWRCISLFRKGFSSVSFWRGLGACGVNNISVCYEPVCDSFVSVCRLSSAVVPFRRTSDKSRIPFACGLWRDSLILFCCNSPMSVYPLLLRGSLLGNKEKGLGMKTTGNKAFTWFARKVVFLLRSGI